MRVPLLVELLRPARFGFHARLSDTRERSFDNSESVVELLICDYKRNEHPEHVPVTSRRQQNQPVFVAVSNDLLCFFLGRLAGFSRPPQPCLPAPRAAGGT